MLSVMRNNQIISSDKEAAIYLSISNFGERHRHCPYKWSPIWLYGNAAWLLYETSSSKLARRIICHFNASLEIIRDRKQCDSYFAAFQIENGIRCRHQQVNNNADYEICRIFKAIDSRYGIPRQLDARALYGKAMKSLASLSHNEHGRGYYRGQEMST